MIEKGGEYPCQEFALAFMANNPINFSITTNRLDVRGMQLEFLGASQYFPNRTQPILPTLPPNPSMQDWQQYENEMDRYRDEIEKQAADLRTSTEANILFLENDTDLYWTFPFENITYPNYPTFSGVKQNLTYPVGGKFRIGVTVTLSDGVVVGYGIGNTA